MTYPIGDACIVSDASLQLDLDGEMVLPVLNTDYHFITTGTMAKSGMVYNATKDDLLEIADYSRFKDRFVLVDTAHYSDMEIVYISKKLSTYADIQGLLLIADYQDKIGNPMPDYSGQFFSLRVTRSLAERIAQSGEARVTISAEVQRLQGDGINLIGILNARDSELSDEAIMIVMPYNYQNESGRRVLQFCVAFMTYLCEKTENKRSVIFAFIDGTATDTKHGIFNLAADFPYSPAKVEAVIDLTGLSASSFDSVRFSDKQAPITRQYAWSLAHHIEKRLAEEKIAIVPLNTLFSGDEYIFTEHPSDNSIFWDIGIAAIPLKTDAAGEGEFSLEDLGRILMEVIDQSNY